MSRPHGTTGLIGRFGRASGMASCPHAALWLALLQSIKDASVPPPNQMPARAASLIIFLLTTYSPSFSTLSPPLAWRGQTVGISLNARMSIGCQQRLTGMPPSPPLTSLRIKPHHHHHHHQATDTRLAKWRQPRAIFRNVGQNLTQTGWHDF